MSRRRRPGQGLRSNFNQKTCCRIPGLRTTFRHGYSMGIVDENSLEAQGSLRRDLIKKIESGIYDNASEDGDDFSSFELDNEEMDDDFSMDNLQLSHMSTSSSSAPNYFQGSRNSMILPLLLMERGEALSSSMYSDTKAIEKSPEDDPELEYEYGPGISLGQFEFAQEEAILGGNPFIDYEADLQLAAELGKTLLERNKELENVVKQQQSMVEDQSHEIEYLTKQNLALREVNESRLKVYEQLEVSINELEDSNRKLVEESKCDKSRIKSLTLTNDRLEARLEELQRSLEESSSNRIVPRSTRRERRRSSDSSGTSSCSVSEKSSKSCPEKFWESNENIILNKGECENHTTDDESNKCSTFIESKRETSIEDGEEEEEEEEEVVEAASSSEIFSRIGSNSPASSGYSSDQPYHISAQNKSSSLPKKDHNSGSSICVSPVDEIVNSAKISEQTINELQKAFAHLDSENALLKEEIEKSKQVKDLDTVQEEVLKVHDVKIGKLCRRCLGTIENPLTQGLTAVQNIVKQVQGDLIKELFRQHHPVANSTSGLSSKEQFPTLRRDWRLLIRSQNKWLDLWLLCSCLLTLTLGLGISLISY